MEPAIGRFTDSARNALAHATEEARFLDHHFVGTEHILLGLLHVENSITAEGLTRLHISRLGVRQIVLQRLDSHPTQSPANSPRFTPRAKQVLELSLRAALQLGHDRIGPEHMLLGTVVEAESAGAQILVRS